MGQRGPRPGPKRKAGGRPVYKAGVPPCPGWLNATAKKVWKRTAAELVTAGTVAVIDQDMLAAYATAMADLEAIAVALDHGGLVVKVESVDRNGRPTGHAKTVTNPLLKAKNEVLGRVQQLAGALGIGPVSRTRVESAPAVGADPAPNKVLELRARIEAARANPGA